MAAILNNKKGFMFTLTVIIMFTLFFLTFAVYKDVDEKRSVQSRVESLNEFLFQTEQDIARRGYLAAYRIIVIAEKDIVENQVYLTNFSNITEELFLYGTLRGVPQDFMSGATASDIEASIVDKATMLNANLTVNNISLFLTQTNPWYLKAIIQINFSLKDKMNLSSWHILKNISSEVDIQNFEDPIYIVNTQGVVAKKFKKAPYTEFVSGANLNNLSMHIANSTYIAHDDAPSFIDRFEGRLSASIYGIESLVNLEELANQGFTAINKSVVDYIYFSPNNPSIKRVTGMPSWFRIDSLHEDIYNVTSLTY